MALEPPTSPTSPKSPKSPKPPKPSKGSSSPGKVMKTAMKAALVTPMKATPKTKHSPKTPKTPKTPKMPKTPKTPRRLLSEVHSDYCLVVEHGRGKDKAIASCYTKKFLVKQRGLPISFIYNVCFFNVLVLYCIHWCIGMAGRFIDYRFRSLRM